MDGCSGDSTEWRDLDDRALLDEDGDELLDHTGQVIIGDRIYIWTDVPEGAG